MAEKRKADITFLLRIPSKKKSVKIELFGEHQWSKNEWRREHGKSSKYRIRMDGCWFGGKGQEKTFYTKYEFRDLLWRSIKDKF